MSLSPSWDLNFDSAPFCNGSLHLGHVRNYALGDVRARWLRSIGTDVTYATAFDSFGLPNEQGARAARIPTDEYVRRQTARIGAQFDRLGLSYDVPPRDYSSPDQYRWSQWLFLRMWDAGLIYRAERDVSWCPRCEEVISVTQVEGDRCWRCDGPADIRLSPEWYIRSTAYSDRLHRGIDGLDGWSERARKLARQSILRAESLDAKGHGTGDWLVSRVRTWGTPLPAVECPTCGIAPVSDGDLPVRLMEHGGSGEATCRSCSGRRKLVGRTLDCFFDDAWCFEGATRGVTISSNPFEAWATRPPARVHFHAGHDAFAYLFVFRLIAHVLHDLGLSSRTEPIDWFAGHDVVTADGRKMAKRYGNAPELDELLETEGAAVLRLAVLAGANPDRPVAWSDDALVRGRRFARTLDRLREVAGSAALSADEHGWPPAPLIHAPDPPIHGSRVTARIDRFLSEYRIASAVDVLYTSSERWLRDERRRTEHLLGLLSRWNLVIPPDLSCGQRPSP